MNARRPIRVLATMAVFVAIWLLWSGHYTPLVLALGALSCSLVTWLALRVGFADVAAYVPRKVFALLPFWLWLLKEIVLSNLAVARVILRPRLAIDPAIVVLETAGLSQVSQAILANAITLTPGTLSVDVHEGRIEVHCLTAESASALREGEMLRRVAALEAR